MVLSMKILSACQWVRTRRHFFAFSFSLDDDRLISPVDCRWERSVGESEKKYFLSSLSEYQEKERGKKSFVYWFRAFLFCPSHIMKSIVHEKAFQLELLKSTAWISGSIRWASINAHEVIATSRMTTFPFDEEHQMITDEKPSILRSGLAWRFDRAAKDMVTLSDEGIKLEDWVFSAMRSTANRSSESEGKNSDCHATDIELDAYFRGIEISYSLAVSTQSSMESRKRRESEDRRTVGSSFSGWMWMSVSIFAISDIINNHYGNKHRTIHCTGHCHTDRGMSTYQFLQVFFGESTLLESSREHHSRIALNVEDERFALVLIILFGDISPGFLPFRMVIGRMFTRVRLGIACHCTGSCTMRMDV